MNMNHEITAQFDIRDAGEIIFHRLRDGKSIPADFVYAGAFTDTEGHKITIRASKKGIYEPST